MTIFTENYEFVTALTNILITIVASIACYKLNKNIKNRKWVIFFLLFAICGLMGTIIHGITFKDTYLKILWMILSLIFTFTVTTLVYILKNNKKSTYRNIIFTSVLIYLIFFFESIAGIDFLLSFIIYAGICLVYSLYLLIRNGIIKNIFLIIAILIQIIGGIFLLFSIKIPSLMIDENSIYHLFTVISLIFFYIGAYQKRWQK